MLSNILHKKDTWPESTDKRFSFWYIAILIIIGLLIVITAVFSVTSCKEQRKLEEERKVLQKSKDSLEEQLIIIPPVPASPAPTIKEPGMISVDLPISL